MNLRNDVALGLVDPIAECARLYPDHPGYESKEGATAALFAHYDRARLRSAGERVPPYHWAGPHELRAMAQYLREPILVFDTRSSNDAHIQRFLYKLHRLPNNVDHESGHVAAFTDREATEYRRTSFDLHVLPTSLVLRHDERHFYGVGHGELYLKWRAEGDPAFAADISDTFSWKEDVNNLTDAERTMDLASVNQLADRADVNSIQIKRQEMRARLHVVHARLGRPILDAAYRPIASDADLQQEEQHIHTAYGIDAYSTGSQQDETNGNEVWSMPTRYARPAYGDLVQNTYFRLLRASKSVSMDEEDVPLADLIAAANLEAFSKWGVHFRETFQIPLTKRRGSRPTDITKWLLKDHQALRQLFAFLPYPEHEAKNWALAHLIKWGELELHNERLAAIQRLAGDDTFDASPRKYCEEWLTAYLECGDDSVAASDLVVSPERWARLAQRILDNYCRAQPEGLPHTEWCLLHVMSYVVSD